MKLENKYGSKNNYIKLHCEGCAKTLRIESAGLKDLDWEWIGIFEGLALQHEMRHPKHNPSVTVYTRIPTNNELSGK